MTADSYYSGGDALWTRILIREFQLLFVKGKEVVEFCLAGRLCPEF